MSRMRCTTCWSSATPPISDRSRRSRTPLTICSDHQIAMLAGMRVAFESMLAEFDPEGLQQDFDRQLKRVPLLGCRRSCATGSCSASDSEEIAKDPEAAFARCSATSSAKAYEEQFKHLKAGAPHHAPAPPVGRLNAGTRCTIRLIGIDWVLQRFTASLSGASPVSNKVIWSEGLFLQPQHFQQQERYFERYVETRCQCARPAQLGLHRDRVRARFSEHRQVRACGAWPACFPDGTPFRMPDDDPLPTPIDIGADVRDQTAVPGGAAAPRRRARGRPEAGTDELVRHDVARAAGAQRRRRAAAIRRCSKSARCARGCCWRARSPRPMPACRSRTSSNAAPISRSCSTSSFIPTVLHVRAADRLATVDHRAARAACISAAKRWAAACRRPAAARPRSSPTS